MNFSNIDKNSIVLQECKNPKFIKVKEICYTQDGVKKTWEVALTHDSVSILIINKIKNTFTFVKQFRPPVFLKNNDGFTYELCAGIIDKDMSIEQIAKEEILEECGYNVPLDNIHKIKSFFSAVGFAGAKQNLFFAFIDDSMKVSNGGGIGQERIEVIELDIDKAYEVLDNYCVTPAVLFAILQYERLYKK
jgi:UDP-sugar diphosphatase